MKVLYQKVAEKYFFDIVCETYTELQILQDTLPWSAMLKLRRLPRIRGFKVENPGSKLEEDVEISHVLKSKRVYWAIVMNTLWSFHQTFCHRMLMRRNLLKILLGA